MRSHDTDLLRVGAWHHPYAARWILANQSRMTSAEQQALKVTICPTNSDSLHESLMIDAFANFGCDGSPNVRRIK